MAHELPSRGVIADAKDRAFRTFLQGLGLDLAVAIAAFILVAIPDLDVSSGEAWTVLGVTLLKTVLQTIASYVMRLKVQPGSQV